MIGPQTLPTAADQTDGAHPGWISIELPGGSFGWQPPGTVGGRAAIPQSITVDTALSTTSGNPVANSVIEAALPTFVEHAFDNANFAFAESSTDAEALAEFTRLSAKVGDAGARTTARGQRQVWERTASGVRRESTTMPLYDGDRPAAAEFAPLSRFEWFTPAGLTEVYEVNGAGALNKVSTTPTPRLSGRFAGSASTFAALPEQHSDGTTATDGDSATLTTLDGAHLPGTYRRASGAWALEEWVGRTGVIDVTQHGVIATPASVDVTDAANAADFIDSGPALIALRDRLVAIDRWRHWTLLFPATDGCYQWKNNRWLYGIVNFTVSAKGAKMQCIFDGINAVSDTPWLPRNDSIFTNKGDDVFAGGTGYISGYQIDTAGNRQRVIQLKDVADATHFWEKQRVIIHSVVQQGYGYSPNLRYFEWAVVNSVNGASIELERPLVYSHHDDGQDYVYQLAGGDHQPSDCVFGKGRVLPLDDRPTTSGPNYFYHENAIFIGGVWLTNPVQAGATNGFTISARRVTLKDMSITGARSRIFARESEYYVIQNVDIDGQIEADKVVDLLEMTRTAVTEAEDATMHSFKAGTGCNRIKMRECFSATRINMIAQERLEIENCTAFANAVGETGGQFSDGSNASAPITLYNGSQGCASVKVTGGRLQVPPGGHVVWAGIAGGTRPNFKNYVVPGVDGASILVDRVDPGSEGEGPTEILSSLRTGFVVRDNSGVVIGQVEAIREYSATQVALVLNVTGAMPTAGDTVRYAPVQRVEVDGEVLWDEAIP